MSTQLVKKWEAACADLAKAKTKELELRNKLIGKAGNLTEGTNSVEIAGIPFKITQPYSRNVDQATLEAVWPKIPEGVRDTAIRFKPELKLKEYKQMSAAQTRLLDTAVTTKPGQPSIKRA